MTRDELYQVLFSASIKNNVTVEFFTAAGLKLLSQTTAIMSVNENHSAHPLEPLRYDMINTIEIDEEGNVGSISEAWFAIPGSDHVERIERVDGGTEQTIAVDCEYVYYVVLNDGITIRIEI